MPKVVSKHRFGFLFLLTVLLGLSNPGHAGREPEDWDTLPQMADISFSSTSVGFSSYAQKYFILERNSGKFQEVGKNSFSREFPESDKMKPAETIQEKGINSMVRLRASNGKEFKTENAYCSEGENGHHKLWRNDEMISDQVNPCASISAIEIVRDQLWLGTRYDGEYGDYPAQGIVIQSLGNGELIRALDSKNGLTGNLIRVIRLDPHRDHVWVATEKGLNEITPDLEIASPRFFREDFNPDTGKPEIGLSSRWETSDPFAVMGRWLGVPNFKNYYQAVKNIPEEIRSKFSLYNFHAGTYSLANARVIEQSFVPKEMNSLIPFYLEAAQSNRKRNKLQAFQMLCMFNDQMVYELFHSFIKNTPDEKGEINTVWQSRIARDCLDKFNKLGLVGKPQRKERIKDLLLQIQSALGKIQSARPRNSAPFKEVQTVVAAAKSLKTAGNLEGFERLNRYFQASDGNRRDGSLYDRVVQQFIYNDEITPAVLEGLNKIQSNNMYRGCSFFNMKYETLHGKRYNARYAEAILTALDRAVHLSKLPGRKKTYDYAIKVCEEALKSQIADEGVKKEFYERIYPGLSQTQKEVFTEIFH